MSGKCREKMKGRGASGSRRRLGIECLNSGLCSPASGLRIPGPTAFVLGKVLKIKEPAGPAPLIFVPEEAYGSKLPTLLQHKNQGLA